MISTNDIPELQSDSLLASLFTDKRTGATDNRADSAPESFVPAEPQSFEEADLTEVDVEALVLKFLANRTAATGTEIAEQVKLPFKLIDPLLRRLKEEQFTRYKGMGSLHDYIHEITDTGAEKASRFLDRSTYYGSAPVSLNDYVSSVTAQSINGRKPSMEALRLAFSDLLLSKDLFHRIGRAIHAGRGLFLYGNPGNGKTSIAERISSAFGDSIWIPRTINVWGEIVRLFDPSSHQELPLPASIGLSGGLKHDRRWVRIKRPTIVVGGELTMDNLELMRDHETGIGEAPVQLKSNCGTLLIDDFGRQRMSEVELLNRWILPLEKGYDILCMASGRKVQVPFDQMIVFSTNLEPHELVDEAFLRRIPYKIEAKDPTTDEFRELFARQAASCQIECPKASIDYLIERHYKTMNRSMRCCHPRDLLLQIRNYCSFEDLPLVATKEALDAAVESYFGVIDGTNAR